MRRITCVVDMHLKGPGIHERTQAFEKLCTLMMLLGVWETTKLTCVCGCSNTKIWFIDWKRQLEYIEARKTVMGYLGIKPR